MARNIKDRRIFAYENFTGMDTFHKPLKVANQRATGGKNFIIDSKILKTRPGFVIDTELGFIGANDYLIDMTEFKGVEIYVTKNHIYVKQDEDTIKTERDINPLLFTFDNTGLEPIFQTEKDVLFIFGLGDIYVFAVFEEHLFLYELNQKPDNQFMSNTEVYKFYQELPTPYEPTLFIGGNRFEDVNLLSNVSKYEIFANAHTAESGEIVVDLPTHFSYDKHVDFEIEASFYNDRFKELGMIPVYIGVIGQDIPKMLPSEVQLLYGAFWTDVDMYEPFIAKEDRVVFYEKIDNEYVEVKAEPYNIGITKEKFFNSYVDVGEKTKVMDFLYEQIQDIKAGNESGNHLIEFLSISKVRNVKKDIADNSIIGSEIVEDGFKIYVQLKQSEVAATTLENARVRKTNIELVSTSPETDDYPVLSDDEYDDIIEIDSEAKPFVSEQDFISRARTYFFTRRGRSGNYWNDYWKMLFTQKYYREVGTQDKSFTIAKILPPPTYKEFEQKSGNENDFPDFNTSGYIPSNVVDGWSISPAIIQIETPFLNLSSSNIKALIEERLSAVFDFYLNGGSKLIADTGEAIMKLKFSYHGFAPDGINYDYLINWSVLVPFNYTKSAKKYEKFSYGYEFIIKDNEDVPAEFYTVDFVERDNVFRMKIKDYFIDINNEPSIKVRVKFAQNPDYRYIADSRFGINFGLENRLFLAGNKEFPNIDRYNVSNDLLGGNIKNQSYELSYFPSKNYRTVGGGGAINGYVVATDNVLYVTKEESVNDSKLFIRERRMDDDGNLLYFESRTNINKTPLNHKVITRFENDIIMLTKDGLYAIQLSSNVLTNERMLRLRSLLINDTLIQTIKNAENLFMFTNDNYLYIFSDENIFVADSRYMAKYDDRLEEQILYEFVIWETPHKFRKAILHNEQIKLILKSHNSLYKFDDMVGHDDVLSDDKKNFSPFFYDDFKISHTIGNVLDEYLPEYETISLLTKYGRKYISLIFDYFVNGMKRTLMFISNVKQKYTILKVEDGESEQDYLARVESTIDFYYDGSYYDEYNFLTFLGLEKPIELNWISNISPFGSDLYEKTLFSCNMYFSTLEKANKVLLGYRIMRTLRDIDMQETFNIPNPFDFNNFNFFAFSTFPEIGTSFPIKENNFLYIQFFFRAFGKVEINKISFVYKNNRTIKSIS